MPFLYGNHVAKAHLGRITEDTPEHQAVVVYSMSDVPLVRSVVAVARAHSIRASASLRDRPWTRASRIRRRSWSSIKQTWAKCVASRRVVR